MKINEPKIKLVLRIILGIVFILSAFGKLLGPDNFLKEVGKISFLPPSLDIIIGYAFILFEFILGILMVMKSSNKLFLITGLTVLVLACYLGYKVITHDNSDCGCFGSFIHRSNVVALFYDIFILITVVYLYEE